MFKTLINGEAQTTIQVTNRGLHYGDGVFETIAVRAGIPQLWHRHWRRLSRGCARLGIMGIEEAILQNEAHEVCAGMDRGVLKLLVTRGSGGRGYRPDRNCQATRILATYAWPDYPAAHWQEGVAVRVCATRLGRNTALAGLKHLNRLEQVMARREWDEPDIAEGLMLDDRGRVISGTMSNLFMVKGARLLTPRLDECGVEGVMRGVILDLAHELTIPAEEVTLTLHDLHQAEELFLSNALIGIWPVRRVEQQDNVVGPVTLLLAERLTSLQHSIGVKEA
jgi:4-amino-4-deoxychorismate lyase